MSSPPKEKVETKAGHLPAVKAGGMRIVKKHQGPVTQASAGEKDKESEDWESNSYFLGYDQLKKMLPSLQDLSSLSCIQKGNNGTRHHTANICLPKPTVPIIISGAVARGDKDFPPAAAQVAHQKPYPSVEKLPLSHQINHSIHQPRK